MADDYPTNMIDDHFEQIPPLLIYKLRSLKNAIQSLGTKLGLESKYLSQNSSNINNPLNEIESNIDDCLLAVSSQLTLISYPNQTPTSQIDTSQLNSLLEHHNTRLQTDYIKPSKMQKQVESPENTENIAKKNLWQIDESSRLGN